jgi:hypothetical protein
MCEETVGSREDEQNKPLPPRLPSEASANVSVAGFRTHRFKPTCRTSQAFSPVSSLAFVPVYRCGAVPELHRIPFSSSVAGRTIGMEPTISWADGVCNPNFLWNSDSKPSRAHSTTTQREPGFGPFSLADDEAWVRIHLVAIVPRSRRAEGFEPLRQKKLRES